MQAAALAALTATRHGGHRKGLVVLATGLGKTYLAAFDSREFARVLLVAHRREILDQATTTFRRVRPDARIGTFTGIRKDHAADVVREFAPCLPAALRARVLATRLLDLRGVARLRAEGLWG